MGRFSSGQPLCWSKLNWIRGGSGKYWIRGGSESSTDSKDSDPEAPDPRWIQKHRRLCGGGGPPPARLLTTNDANSRVAIRSMAESSRSVIPSGSVLPCACRGGGRKASTL